MTSPSLSAVRRMPGWMTSFADPAPAGFRIALDPAAGIAGDGLMPECADMRRFREALPGLAGDLGPDGLDQILESFLEDSGARIASLETLLAAGDLADLGRCAHSIQGGSGIFGLTDLGHLALEVELAALASETDRLAGLVAELRAAYRMLDPLLREAARGLARRTGG